MSEVIVEELFDELYELARWEGCETGDLCFALMDFWESYSKYTSINLQKALEQEIISLYDTLKEEKMDNDIQVIEAHNRMSVDEKREIVLNKLSREDRAILGL